MVLRTCKWLSSQIYLFFLYNVRMKKNIVVVVMLIICVVGVYGYLKPLPENKRLQFIEFHSKLWKKQTEVLLKAFEEHDPNLKFLIKYEDFLKDVLNYSKKIYEFLGIKVDEKKIEKIVTKYSFENLPSEIKGKGKVFRSASPGNWKVNFSEKEKELMNSSMIDTLKKLNYEH